MPTPIKMCIQCAHFYDLEKPNRALKNHFSKVDSTINQLQDLRIRAGEAAQQVEVPVSRLDCLSSVFRTDRAEGEKWPSQTVL